MDNNYLTSVVQRRNRPEHCKTWAKNLLLLDWFGFLVARWLCCRESFPLVSEVTKQTHPLRDSQRIKVNFKYDGESATILYSSSYFSVKFLFLCHEKKYSNYW